MRPISIGESYGYGIETTYAHTAEALGNKGVTVVATPTLTLLRHKMRDFLRGIFRAQQGHLDKVCASATMMRRRGVAIEFGM